MRFGWACPPRCAWSTPWPSGAKSSGWPAKTPARTSWWPCFSTGSTGPKIGCSIIGQYLKQLRRIAERFEIPLITGQTPNAEREELYGKFRRGVLRRLILSKVGNFAIDLPDANVMVQVSGTFGSRQEEAQRLGRILRPKEGEVPARFYTLVSRDTREMDFAHHRQLFLTEQGYTYEILDESDLAAPVAVRPAATV